MRTLASELRVPYLDVLGLSDEPAMHPLYHGNHFIQVRRSDSDD